MQTAFHILSLISESRKEIIGSQIIATEFYKKERAAYFFFKKKQRFALTFIYHPTRFGTFLVPASKVKITTREKPWPIFKIDGAVVTSVEQLGFDRLFKITVEHNSFKKTLIFEAIGPNGNIWLLDENELKQATLRKKNFQAGDIYQPFAVKNKLNPLLLTAKGFIDFSKDKPEMLLEHFIERNIVGCNQTIAREIIKRATLETLTSKNLDNDSCRKLIKAIEQIIALFKRPEVGYLYKVGNTFEAYPFKLSSSEQRPQRFKTLSLAVMASTEKRQAVFVLEDEEKNIKNAVKSTVKRLKKRIVNIESDIKDAASYERYKKYGELLKINLTKIKKGMESIIVEDIFLVPHKTITINLEPSLTPNENSELYFKKFRKGREGLTLLERRLTITKEELSKLMKILSELENDFETAQKRYNQELLSLLPKENIEQEIQERLPYREYLLSTGLKVFVGRDGADNDRTTFEFAKPYELWFHTQQCAGSHVVMKFPNKSFEPSRFEIEETASIAAYFSKARNDSLVPVTYTQRKYVRKPRKAKSGLVTVERVKSVMVPPKKPE